VQNEEEQMTFLLRSVPTAGPYDEALAEWRSAAAQADDRWQQFKASERAARPFMFAAYMAALDREEAAAGQLALLTLDRAA
jgi:hypothetical protein